MNGELDFVAETRYMFNKKSASLYLDSKRRIKPFSKHVIVKKKCKQFSFKCGALIGTC